MKGLACLPSFAKQRVDRRQAASDPPIIDKQTNGQTEKSQARTPKPIAASSKILPLGYSALLALINFLLLWPQRFLLVAQKLIFWHWGGELLFFFSYLTNVYWASHFTTHSWSVRLDQSSRLSSLIELVSIIMRQITMLHCWCGQWASPAMQEFNNCYT